MQGRSSLSSTKTTSIMQVAVPFYGSFLMGPCDDLALHDRSHVFAAWSG